MITIPLAVTLGAPKQSNTVTVARGEKIRMRATVTSAGVAVDLSTHSVLLGWDTDAGTTPKPAPVRVSGDSTGIVDFDIETAALTADNYAYDLWIEDEVTFERQRIVKRSGVTLTGAVSDMNYAPTITMASIAASVPTGALAISGTVTDQDGTLTGASIVVTVNGVAQVVTVNLAAGTWDTTLTLTAGAKTIVATVTDSHGLTASATRTTTAVTP
jgi:hypothetical protein